MFKNKARYKIKCQVCGKEVLGWRRNQKYCSRECWEKRVSKIKRICGYCRKEFWVNPCKIRNQRGIYCSVKCRKKAMVGEKSATWKGGKRRTSKGYILIYEPKHPFAKQGCVFKHRLVMEKYLGRYLELYEQIHHKNGIKDDNRIENLEIVITNPHHGKVKCPFCRKKFLIR